MALRRSAKDQREHRFARDSVRDRLAALCRDFWLAAEPSLLVLPNIVHLATKVEGLLADPISALQLVGLLHPTAAVCGTPMTEALSIIRRVETNRRGRYAGPVGWVDSAGNGEWGIALRCAEVSGPDVRVHAGAGLVEGSEAAAEFAETATKLSAVLGAFDLMQGAVSHPHPR